MGRKDANNATSLPVDQYRKQIGRHESRRDRKDLKELKRHREAKKSAMAVQDVALVFIAIFAVIAGLYCLLYFYLIPNSSTDSASYAPTEDEHK